MFWAVMIIDALLALEINSSDKLKTVGRISHRKLRPLRPTYG